MEKKNIAIKDFNADIFTAFDKEWMLVTAGNKDDFNTMTISWGFMGTMWAKPIVIVPVRPVRYTYEYTEKSPDFTITAFPPQYKAQLLLCGTKSGRDIDKVAECDFHPTVSEKVESPGFEEAELIIECKKVFHNDILEDRFFDPAILKKQYPKPDYHRMYFGEVMNIMGTDKFCKS